MHTLILNADGQPISLVPISSVSWQDGISDVWSKKTEALHYYDNWWVRSPSTQMRVPAVSILKSMVNVRHNFRGEGGGPRSELLFLRDGYQCQYCTKIFPASQLTKDHVIPVCKGGKTTWENLACCCERCNSDRGHNEKIQPIRKPFRPTYYQLLSNKKKFPITIPHESWNYFLMWDESLVTVKPPKADLP